MPAEMLWQIALTVATAFGGAFFGARLTIARLEERVGYHAVELKRLLEKLSEHEGTINSHSIQLAVLDGTNRPRS